MRKRILIPALAAFVMILTLSVPSALAYFTTYVRAQGMKEVKLTDHTELTEPQVVNKEKHVVITADPDSDPVWVRARAYAPENLQVYYTNTTGWTESESDDWWYYNTSIKGGESTSELLVSISFPENAKDGDTFNVVVVYECTPVLGDTGPVNADWSVPVKEKTGGGN